MRRIVLLDGGLLQDVGIGSLKYSCNTWQFLSDERGSESQLFISVQVSVKYYSVSVSVCLALCVCEYVWCLYVCVCPCVFV